MLKPLILLLFVVSCRQPLATSKADVDHTYWQQSLEYGDTDKFAVKAEAYIKNTGSDLNRQTTSRLYADAWLFGKKFKDENQDGNIFDFAAIINRGTLSSHTYLRFLNETKFSDSTNEPSVNFSIIRKSYENDSKVPLLSKKSASIDLEVGIRASVDTKFEIVSPDDFELEGSFEPEVLIEGDFSSVFDPKYWAEAHVDGNLTILDYKLKAAISAVYQKSSSKLTSLVTIVHQRLTALSGDIRVKASMKPENVPYIGEVFGIDTEAVTTFVNKLQLQLSKKLFKLVTRRDDGWDFEKTVFTGAVAENKELFSGTLQEVKLLDSSSDTASCKDRALDLVQEAREMNNILKGIASQPNEEGYKLSKLIGAQLAEAKRQLDLCEGLE